jgi:hypothetical protein
MGVGRFARLGPGARSEQTDPEQDLKQIVRKETWLGPRDGRQGAGGRGRPVTDIRRRCPGGCACWDPPSSAMKRFSAASYCFGEAPTRPSGRACCRACVRISHEVTRAIGSDEFLRPPCERVGALASFSANTFGLGAPFCPRSFRVVNYGLIAKEVLERSELLPPGKVRRWKSSLTNSDSWATVIRSWHTCC